MKTLKPFSAFAGAAIGLAGRAASSRAQERRFYE